MLLMSARKDDPLTEEDQGRAEGWFLAALLYLPFAHQVLHLLLAPPENLGLANLFSEQNVRKFSLCPAKVNGCEFRQFYEYLNPLQHAPEEDPAKEECLSYVGANDLRNDARVCGHWPKLKFKTRH